METKIEIKKCADCPCNSVQFNWDETTCGLIYLLSGETPLEYGKENCPLKNGKLTLELTDGSQKTNT